MQALQDLINDVGDAESDANVGDDKPFDISSYIINKMSDNLSLAV